MRTMILDRGYAVLQDVHDLGERFGLYRPEFNPYAEANAHCISPFRPLKRLEHLQLTFAAQPYFGRELRYFNAAPWWYRLEFEVPEDAPAHAIVRVGAADYFADVWLNGEKLGSHEGYFAPFEFSADGAVRRGQTNVLILRVSAPWDEEKHDGVAPLRCWNIVRNLMKGTYEHADSFLCRDVNPVGLLKPVEIDFFEGARIARADVRAALENGAGRLRVAVRLNGQGGVVRLRLTEASSGALVAQATSDQCFDLAVPDVLPWTIPERGESHRYRLALELIEDGKTVQTVCRTVGFKRIELRRTPERTEYYLNGERLYVRGTTYFPEVYTSRMDERKYRRDLQLLRDAGMNMVRIHVHVENEAFYDLCDEMGMLVMQDTDLNWVQNRSDEFAARALAVFGEMIDQLGHHPCLATWVLYNEPDRRYEDFYMNVQPAPQLEIMAHDRTPEIPTIRGSYIAEALHSGDSHNYTGSLYGEGQSYLEKLNNEKFNTEFGFDAPAGEKNLARIPEIWERLGLAQAEIDAIDEYQYRYTKHFIEHYRIHKYDVCAGYMQFLFSDPLPQSFYGAVDWWGSPKGAFRAMLESNQPIAVLFEHDTEPRALWVVNDTAWALRGRLRAVCTDAQGAVLENIDEAVEVAADGALRACDFARCTKGATVYLTLWGEDGRLLSQNRYVDPLTHPQHPAGHPGYMDNDLSMHLYRAAR